MSEQILKRIDTKLTNLMNRPKAEPETWVKASVITRKTGWDSEGMRTARKYNYIKFKKDEKGGFWYLLESLNPALYQK